MQNQSKIPTTKNWPAEKLNILDSCQLIHKQAEEVYLYLSGIHPEHNQISRMWGLLAIDKCNHSDTFKMAHRLKGAGISEITISAETASTILNKMKAIPRGERCAAPSVVDALRFTVKMEENLACVHFRQAVTYESAKSMALMASSLKSSGDILHMMTEEYVNLTVGGSDAF